MRIREARYFKISGRKNVVQILELPVTLLDLTNFKNLLGLGSCPFWKLIRKESSRKHHGNTKNEPIIFQAICPKKLAKFLYKNVHRHFPVFTEFYKPNQLQHYAI